MLDTFTREISARWGLADQGRPLVQMLVAYISQPETGGLPGFLEQFRKAGWGGMVNTWVDNGGNAEIPTTAQVEAVLGGSHGLLQQAATQLGLAYDKVIAAVAGALPQLVDRMTPDGTVPAALPPEFGVYAREGQVLLGLGVAAAQRGGGADHAAAPAALASPVPSSSGGLGKWLPWLMGALLVIFGVSYCSQNKEPVATSSSSSLGSVAPTEPTALPSMESGPLAPMLPTDPAAPETATPATGAPDSAAPADMPAASAAEPDAPATADASGTAAGSGSTDSAATADSAATTAPSEDFTVPQGAGVVEAMHNGMPVLHVFFETGQTEVDAAFAGKSQSLVDFLNANPDAQALISGFNDSTGDAARNAELAKQRAQAVKAALESAGIAPERAQLDKPAETASTGATDAASRRVDVVLRR